MRKTLCALTLSLTALFGCKVVFEDSAVALPKECAKITSKTQVADTTWILTCTTAEGWDQFYGRKSTDAYWKHYRVDHWNRYDPAENE